MTDTERGLVEDARHSYPGHGLVRGSAIFRQWEIVLGLAEALEARLDAEMVGPFVCEACQVRQPWEHRCYVEQKGKVCYCATCHPEVAESYIRQLLRERDEARTRLKWLLEENQGIRIREAKA